MATAVNVDEKAQAKAEKFEENVRVLQTYPKLWKQFMQFQEAVKENEKAQMAGKTFARLLVKSVQVDKTTKLKERIARLDANREKLVAELAELS